MAKITGRDVQYMVGHTADVDKGMDTWLIERACVIGTSSVDVAEIRVST